MLVSHTYHRFTGTRGCALMVQQRSDERMMCKNRILTRSHISPELSLSLLLPPEVQLNSSSGTDTEAQSSLRHETPQKEIPSLQYKAGPVRWGPVHQLLQKKINSAFSASARFYLWLQDAGRQVRITKPDRAMGFLRHSPVTEYPGWTGWVILALSLWSCIWGNPVLVMLKKL